MKAEHRKELQTNELADWLGRTVQNIKSGNRTHLMWGLLAVAIIGLAGYWIWEMSSRPSSKLDVLLKIQGAGADVKELERIAKDKTSGALPARTAKFELARILYQEGIRDLPSVDLRASAIAKLEQARTQYEELENECGNEPVLAQEALMWKARSEEALIGAVNPDKPKDGPVGNIDRAIEYYQKLAAMAAEKKTPETFETKAAAERAKLLQDKKSQIQDFYTKLNEQPSKLKK